MNIDTARYYSSFVVFSDLSKTAGELVPYNLNSGEWKADELEEIPVLASGYPTQVPIQKNGKEYGVRLIFQNRPGTYMVTYEGSGEIDFKNTARTSKLGLGYKIELDGEHKFHVNIIRSSAEDPIRNLRIIPVWSDGDIEEGTFHPDFVRGLEPFDTIRFYKWQDCDVVTERKWTDRRDADYFSQANFASLELAVELANTLNKNAWFCVPYAADDEYIFNMASYVKDNLSPDLKIYIEYSNELWNFRFLGSRYVFNEGISDLFPQLNADKKVQQDLSDIREKYCGKGDCHPEKDAYMMARTFKIWDSVFGDDPYDRVKTVAGVQQTWPENTVRILDYFEDINYDVDIIAGGGYFKFEQDDHDRWLADRRNNVSAEDVLREAQNYLSKAEEFAISHGDIAKKYDVEYVVYEGGQHLVPFEQKEWSYNQAVYDAQIDPGIYDIYLENLAIYENAGVTNFFAYSYIGERESKWGSWGHIESLEDLSKDLKAVAPKYQALLDYAAAESLDQ